MMGDVTSSEAEDTAGLDAVLGHGIPAPSGQDSKEHKDVVPGLADAPGKEIPGPSLQPGNELADEIQAMKLKLLELERQSFAKAIAPEEEAAHQKLATEMEEYMKMEQFMYRSRKRWENAGGPGNWFMRDNAPRAYMRRDVPHTPWHINWTLRSEKVYPFPNLSRHADDPKLDEFGEYDSYDQTIDYGSRRDRLRKNFEWEMDRLYLSEEFERRKRTKEEEKEAQELQKAEAKKGDEASDEDRYAKPTLNRQPWRLFRGLSRPGEEDEEEPPYVMDILMGVPTYESISGSRSWFAKWDRAPRSLDKALHPEAAATPGMGPLPERVRINSEALLRILEFILGTPPPPPGAKRATASIFIRPFKVLIYCEEELREWCSGLEKKLNGLPSAEQDTTANAEASAGKSPGAPPSVEDAAGLVQSADSPSAAATTGDGDSPKMSEGDSLGSPPEQAVRKENGKGDDEEEPGDLPKHLTHPMALQHLKCLLSFMDSDITARRERLAGSDCRKVFFSDLWFLFRPGTEVISNDGKQAYRVVDVTSAKHRVVAAWERWANDSGSKMKKKFPFSITCVYIDFDGKNIGPVPMTFGFKRFDGEVDITSLEVYPMRFRTSKRSDFTDAEWDLFRSLPEAERYRQKLIARGSKFLNAARVQFKYYAGPTLGMRDEVDSQVVIDFEAAFSVENETQQKWKPFLRTAIEKIAVDDPGPEHGRVNVVDDDDDDEDRDCNAFCCMGEHVHRDEDMDEKFRVDYVNSLLPKAGAVGEQPSIAIMPRALKELQEEDGSISAEDSELLIMSYRVFGFVLRSRKWAQLDLAYLTDVYRSERPASDNSAERGNEEGQRETQSEHVTAFDRLVLEEWHRPMIMSLISQHFRDKKSTEGQGEEFDIVKGKGKGLILLLHGAPGVGKTSTAEGVAELFRKPLFQITCGDLGTTASEVEKALETNFAMASRWDCILLLDEADVFLAERTKEDFTRNGLVAVFLRVMEYYTGVLFLTTNRVGDFDEAFTSRIHVSLYYPELNDRKTIEVFKINMDMIEERFSRQKRLINIDRAGIGAFATQFFKEHPQSRWNGRQIRNACQTALALAEFEAKGNSHHAILRPEAVINLLPRHFDIVRNAYLEFTRYMQDLHGSSAARRAKEARLRAIWVDENDQVVGAGANLRATYRGRGAVLQQQQQQQAPVAQGFQPQAYSLQQPGFPQFQAYQQPVMSVSQQATQPPAPQQQLPVYYQEANPAQLQPHFMDPTQNQQFVAAAATSWGNQAPGMWPVQPPLAPQQTPQQTAPAYGQNQQQPQPQQHPPQQAPQQAPQGGV